METGARKCCNRTATKCEGKEEERCQAGKNQAEMSGQREEKRIMIKGSKRFNALKYVNIYYRSRNIAKGEFIKGSMKVQLQGKAAVSQGALTKHNDGNTIGMNSMAAQVKVDIA